MKDIFFAYKHQGKEEAFRRALRSRGYEETKRPDEASIILSDMDISSRGRNLLEYSRQGKKIFLYPHGGIPNIFWDFPGYEPSPAVSAHFVAAPGHYEVMKAYGYPRPIEVVGWHLSGIRPFRPARDLRRILFAPIHPNNNGFLSRIDREINAETFRRAVRLATDERSSLTVRYLGDLKSNGLWRAGGVMYLQGAPDLSHNEIDRADIVIAHHTFAYIAIARGAPTLMMGEAETPRVGGSEEKLVRSRNWDKYRDLMRYPLDILEGDPFSLAVQATESDRDIIQWRERMIGDVFQPGAFVDCLESYL
jgi:hypothetical protein